MKKIAVICPYRLCAVLALSAVIGSCAPKAPPNTATASSGAGPVRGAVVATATAAPTSAPLPVPVATAANPRQTDASPSISLAATASPIPTGSPLEPSAAPATVAVPVRSASSAATSSPDAAPHILSVRISTTTVHPGEEIDGTVTTSLNVASVEARIGGYSVSVPKSNAGIFALTYRVPLMAYFVRGQYALTLIARNTRGDKTTTSVPITVR